MSEIPILYEDNHILVIEKPPNMPSQEDASKDPDVLTTLKQWLKIKYDKPGNVYLGLVHRLDRPVGGAMVLAKTSKAASRLANEVRLRKIKKHYLAVVHGKPTPNEQRLTHYLWKNEKTNTVYAVDQQHRGAKEATLDYKVRGEQEGLCLVDIQLHTGRSHQIRVQMATIGCPLFGDQKYANKKTPPHKQIALWSSCIGFTHPTTKQYMQFESNPAAHLEPWYFWDLT